MPLTFRAPTPRSRPILKIAVIVVAIVTIILIGAHIMAMKRTIKVAEDEDYQVIQKSWDTIGPDDVAHRHFYWPFVIHMPFAPGEDTLDELNALGVRTFLHGEPTNFAVPIGVLAEISDAGYFMRHSADKMMLHTQYPVTIEMASNPGLNPVPYAGDDANIRDIGEFMQVLEAPVKPHTVQVRIYPNNFIFVPRGWLFRIVDATESDGLLEFFLYETIFSRYL